MSHLRVVAAALFLAALAGCAELHTAGNTLQAWLRDYSWGAYRATPQQTRVADQRASQYYASLPPAKKEAMRTKGTRYLAVRTLNPTPEQNAAIKKKIKSGAYGQSAASYGGGRRRIGPPPAPREPTEPLKCVMIWDTYAKEVVGTNCYAVTDLPPVGETAKFDVYAAEFIGPREG